MRQWLVMFEKEMLELWRSYKWVWIPIVFVLLGIMQPVSSYYLPQILDSVGNLPEGAVIDIPLPTGPQVLMETLSQFNTLGTLVLVLAFMGTIAAERNSGVAGLILVKPVPFGSYITVKWAAAAVVTSVSMLLGLMAAWYYTNQLIGPVPLADAAGGLLLFTLWMLFIVTMAVFFSSIMRAPGAVAFLTLLLAVGVSILTSIFSKYTQWSPGKLSGYAGEWLATGAANADAVLPVVVTMVIIAALLISASVLFRNKELVG